MVLDSLDVRELGHDDLEALLGLYRDLHADDAPLPPERSRALWSAIQADAAQIYLGRFSGSELVAACNASITLNLTRGGRPFAVIENVVTSHAHRRRGHGQAVMRALIDRCWARDCYKVMLMSAAERGEGHAFYESLGFDSSAKQAFVLKPPTGR